MAVRTTFADLLGAIGPMMRAEAGGARFASSPLGDLALVSEDAPGATFSGYLDASHGELSALEWLSGNRFSLQGSKRGDGLFSIVARPPASATDLPKPALSPFAADLAFDRVEFCGKRADDSSGDAPIISFAQAVWKLGARSGNAEDALSAEVALPLLSGDAPLLSIGFFDAAGNPGTVLADASENLHDLLGVRIPFSRYVPSTVPFSNRMRLHRVMLAFNGPVLQARRNANPAQVRSLCLELGFDGADEPAALSNGFALNSVRLELSLPRNVKLSRATAAISADVEVAGVPLTVSASAPRFDIRGTTRFDRPVPLSTVAAKAGFAVPALLDGVSLAYVNLRANLTESDYRAAFAIESAANAHEPFAFSRLDARLERADGVEGRLLGAQAELAGRGGSFSARLSAELSFQKSGKRVCGLGLRGDFGKETRLFGSLMAPFPSFGDVYEALAGASLPQGFPTVKLETLSATVLAGATTSVESFAAAVVLDVDASVFGTAFALRAALSHARQYDGLASLVMQGAFVVPLGVLALLGAGGPVLFVFWLPVAVLMPQGVREATRAFRDDARNRLVRDRLPFGVLELLAFDTLPAFAATTLLACGAVAAMIPIGTSLPLALALAVLVGAASLLCCGLDAVRLFPGGPRLCYEYGALALVGVGFALSLFASAAVAAMGMALFAAAVALVVRFGSECVR